MRPGLELIWAMIAVQCVCLVAGVFFLLRRQMQWWYASFFLFLVPSLTTSFLLYTHRV
jgi:hypothetical protein